MTGACHRVRKLEIESPTKENAEMKLTPPTKLAFWLSVVLAALGLIGVFVTIPVVSVLAFWFVFVGYVVILLGLLVKGF
jgi:hypothetical protein